VATEADLQEMVNEVGGKVDFQQFAHVSTYVCVVNGLAIYVRAVRVQEVMVNVVGGQVDFQQLPR